MENDSIILQFILLIILLFLQKQFYQWFQGTGNAADEDTSVSGNLTIHIKPAAGEVDDKPRTGQEVWAENDKNW